MRRGSCRLLADAGRSCCRCVARRLLRNRVSAQQARERKKAYVATLEGQLQDAEEALAQARAEAASLATDNATLRRLLMTVRTGRPTGRAGANKPAAAGAVLAEAGAAAAASGGGDNGDEDGDGDEDDGELDNVVPNVEPALELTWSGSDIMVPRDEMRAKGDSISDWDDRAVCISGRSMFSQQCVCGARLVFANRCFLCSH